MKKPMMLAVAAAFVVAGVRYSFRNASPALSAVEKQSLRDAPNDDPQGGVWSRLKDKFSLDPANSAPVAAPSSDAKDAADNNGQIVNPAVFDTLIQYEHEMEDAKFNTDNVRFNDKLPAIIFIRDFYSQFLKNDPKYPCHALDIDKLGKNSETLADSTQMSVTQLRAQMADMNEAKEKRYLLAKFEELAEMWPFLTGNNKNDERHDFHADYMPELLKGIVSWAESIHDEPLKTAAVAARQRYLAAAAQAKIDCVPQNESFMKY